MSMSKQILVTKTVGYTQYQLYRVKILYPGTLLDFTGTLIEEKVRINAYGIVAIIFIGREEIYYDSGFLSSQNYEVNWLFHKLVREHTEDINEIRRIICDGYSRFCHTPPYFDPFKRTANKMLRQQLKRNKPIELS